MDGWMDGEEKINIQFHYFTCAAVHLTLLIFISLASTALCLLLFMEKLAISNHQPHISEILFHY